MNYSEFKCKWIDPVSLWNIADETRNEYWPESTLPINTEEIVEFRLRLNIEPVKYLSSTIKLGHFFLHKELYIKFGITSPEDLERLHSQCSRKRIQKL